MHDYYSSMNQGLAFPCNRVNQGKLTIQSYQLDFYVGGIYDEYTLAD